MVSCHNHWVAAIAAAKGILKHPYYIWVAAIAAAEGILNAVVGINKTSIVCGPMDVILVVYRAKSVTSL